jgi:sulfatase modifying factor 1
MMRLIYRLALLLAFSLVAEMAIAQEVSFRGVALDDHRAKIEWSGKAATWTVERRTASTDFDLLATLPGEEKSLVDSTLKVNITYTYRLTATTAAGNSIVNQIRLETHLEPPVIAGILPLTGESALVWWDSVDSNADNVVLEARGIRWNDFSPVGEVDAGQRWIIAHNLEPLRDYDFRLASSTAFNTSDVTAAIPYRHQQPSIEWSVVPECSFVQGGTSGDEAPQREVGLSAFLMSRGEITNQLYLQYCDQEKVSYPEGPKYWGISEYLQRFPNHPVVNVSWFDAIGFCNWLSNQQNLPPAYDSQGKILNSEGCRLPTEAEWEHAARIGGGEYPWGDDPPDSTRANYGHFGRYQIGSESHPQEIGSYPQTPGGFWDLAGNVWEWCQDWYDPAAYKSTDNSDPQGPARGIFKVVRGGSWADDASMLRSCNRGKLSSDVTMSTVGFRVVQPMPVQSLHPRADKTVERQYDVKE